MVGLGGVSQPCQVVPTREPANERDSSDENGWHVSGTMPCCLSKRVELLVGIDYFQNVGEIEYFEAIASRRDSHTSLLVPRSPIERPATQLSSENLS